MPVHPQPDISRRIMIQLGNTVDCAETRWQLGTAVSIDREKGGDSEAGKTPV